ncbi:enoyl-CoA hydratase [Kineococcus xinjiangensis]|uniref:Enoyl-CoA hydratase n=1 Tax=Kineococcus xinjiangensis TaxID=512762 RepID=A0A2S6IK32_9ACTN|nr:enoyl-CoA hydratase/isomerase family protein [Kineococcus xinjiangensis]PPK94592.1 enoyl-CoA hydratase [Kineococcus xinjiangensis]
MTGQPRTGENGEAAVGGLVVSDLGDRVLARIDRPATRNAIDAALVDALHALCAELEREPRPLVLTGGEGIFASGADIRQLRERRRDDALRGINSAVFDRVAKLPMPTVAAVDGHALGGGAELAYACDFRVATTRARFGNPETGLGIMAAAGATWRLRELVGEPLAREILLAGRILDAPESLAAHLVTEVVQPEDLLPAADRLVDRILRNGGLAVRLTKLALRMPPGAHPAFDDVAQAVLFETEEKERRMTAFLERRRPAGGTS